MEYSVSTLKTNTIQAATGTNISMTSGHTLQPNFHSSTVFPAGMVVQTVIGNKFTTKTQSTSTSYTDLVSLAITPKFSSSVLKVCFYYAISGNHAVRLVRDSTTVFQPTNTYLNYDVDSYNQNTNVSNSTRRTRAMSYIDSPASTSAITYKWQVASYNAANGTGLILNELTGTTGSAYTYMEIMEIAQ